MVTLEQGSLLYSPGLVQQERGDVCLLIDPAAPNWASTNAPGSAVIRGCDGRSTLREVSARLGRDLGLDPADVASFLSRAAGLRVNRSDTPL